MLPLKRTKKEYANDTSGGINASPDSSGDASLAISSKVKPTPLAPESASLASFRSAGATHGPGLRHP